MSGQGSPHRCQGKTRGRAILEGQEEGRGQVRAEEVAGERSQGTKFIFLLELEVGSRGLAWARPGGGGWRLG